MGDLTLASDGYGHGRRKRRKSLSLSQFFTNRQSESQAFLESVWARDRDLTEDRVTTDTLDNVLLFYGFGGLGKTQLSLGLQDWISPQVNQGTGVLELHWGVPPAPDRPMVTARWDLNDSGGNLDPVTLLLSIRSALHQQRGDKLPAKTWRAFDIAFSAYVSKVRPGQSLDPTDSGTGYASELPKMFGEIALDTVVDVGAGVGAQGLLDLARGALRHIRKTKAFAEYEDLPGLIENCLTAEAGSVNAELASDVLFLIDCAIKRSDPRNRPLIVVFVDHVERIQGGTSATRAGEQLLNQLVAALPHALFVMTGRNSLDWYDAKRTGLHHAGRRTWPCLQPEIAARSTNPRPHLLKTLSEKDAREWIQRQAKESALPFAPGVIEDLVNVTGRWPVHIDAVFDLARVKVEEGVELLTVAHLDGSFDDIVRRLLEDLPADEQSALQAACLLPYFDAELVRTMTGDHVSNGTIERLVRRAVVLENFDSWYEYRVHEEVRRAVRAAGPHINGGWSNADWAARARAALRNALQAAKDARKAMDDEANLAAIGLAITISAEYGVCVPDSDQPEMDGLAKIRRASPSNTGLLPVIPSSDSIAHLDTRTLVRLIEIISRPVDEAAVADLADISTVSTTVQTDVKIWMGYRLRELGRYDEAAEVFEWLRTQAPDCAFRERRRLYNRQLGVCYSMGRRFVDAAAVLPLMDPDQAATNRFVDLALHGHLTEESFENQRNRISKAQPRFALELEGALHRRLARAGRLDRSAADELLIRAVRFDHRTAQRTVLAARALDDISRGLDFDRGDTGVLDANESQGALGEILAFKALRDGPDEEFLVWLDRAQSRDVRSRDWIPTEMLLHHLGHPLPAVETQWLEPVEVVRQRWVDRYEALLRGARLEAGAE
jgi:hypothetical protein